MFPATCTIPLVMRRDWTMELVMNPVFLVFLLVLSKVECLGPDVPPQISTLRSVTLSIFDQYLKVTRRLQTDYRLEPAGSHGVWGLDDYHCLPFYFGACQLQALSETNTPGLDALTHPSVVNQQDMLREFGDRFLYLGCIRYIRQLKQGVPFFESSPMLYDISQTMNSWDKVARGMLRLYQGEVMDKRQVVQHFVFSKLFPMTWTPSQLTERQAPVETFRVELDDTNPLEASQSNARAESKAAAAAIAANNLSRASNKKRRKKLKLIKKAQAAANAAEALAARTAAVSKMNQAKKIIPAPTSRSTSRKVANIAVACARETMATYRQEVLCSSLS